MRVIFMRDADRDERLPWAEIITTMAVEFLDAVSIDNGVESLIKVSCSEMLRD